MHRRLVCVAGIVCAVLLCAPPFRLKAEATEAQAQAPKPRPSVSAVRVAAPPAIDGRLDDPAWKSAARVTEFVQETPVEGAAATERTDVFIAYDAQFLYVGVHAHYSDPGLIRANRSERDRIDNDDVVSVFIDPFLDHQRAFGFSVNGYGVQGDAMLNPGPFGTQFDKSWNVLFRSAGVLVEGGWTAEMAIPVKSLRYPGREAGEAHRWGFQVQRDIRSKDETVHWSPVSSSIIGQLVQMGALDGVRDLSPGRNLEIMPTATAIRADRLEGGSLTNQEVAEAGINVKYGITSNLTLDATYNPDFSQIESDRPQIDVNLRFPISFPELRPFFLEGQEIFRVQAPVTVVHTRTIVDPQYGAKLSGKIGRTAVALLAANDEAPGKVDDRNNPAFGRTAQFVAARAKHDVYPEAFVGALFTDREFLDTHSRLTGLDGNFPWRGWGGQYLSQAKGLFTHHRDAAGVTRTGHFIDLMTRREGRSLDVLVASNHVSPDFRTDGGFVRRVNHNRGVAWVSYLWWPESWIVNWGPRFEYDRYHTYDTGVLEEEIKLFGVNMLFARNVSASITTTRNGEQFRGVMFDKNRVSMSTSVSASRRVSFNVSMNRGDEIRFVDNPYLGRSRAINTSVTLRPASRFQSQISLNTSRFVDVRTNTEVFDLKLLHALTTYQFTERLLVRNILEHNTLNRTYGVNLLLTYRVNAGTVFFAGYDDRYRDGGQIDSRLFRPDVYQRTNRAIFTKLQYLFRN